MKSLASPKVSSSHHKASSSLSVNSHSQEPFSRLNSTKLNAMKSSEFSERSHMSNSPVPQHQALRDLSNLVGESLLYANLGSAGDTPSDISLANAFNDALPTPGGTHRRMADEVTALRKELEQKNHMIDKLMKENMNLRKEMEEFLTTVDEAREYIDIELKECNNRIHELEAEIQEVRAENHVYKQQLSKQALELASDKRRTPNVDDQVETYYGQAKKDMEDFHFRLNEQIINFMEISKNQYQEFNKMIQNKVSGPKNENVMTCPASPKRDNLTPSLSGNKANGPKPVRNRNSSMSISCKNPRSPSKIMKTPVTPKTPKSLGLENRNHSNKTPKSSNDLSNNKSIDFKNGSLSSTSRMKGGYGSMNQLEADVENNGFVLSSVDLNGQRNPTSHALSPKSSLLRAKLKSDMILQEMRRKLGEGFGQL